jgi:uncharacterized protein (TIGR02391 family)
MLLCGAGASLRFRRVPLPRPDTAAELPVDQLGLIILKELIVSREWNTRNFILRAQREDGYRAGASRALAEAVGWLMARGLIARDADQHSADAIFVTRIGHQVAKEGPDVFYATERLQRNLHAQIEAKARPQFLIGEYEQAVFAAMKAIEIRVRALAKLGDDVIGVDLINRAFGSRGPLTDPTAQKGEQEGTRALFAGAYAVFRNPAGHREVRYDDVSEAAEAVQTASLLMRILDRIEKRLES